MSKSHFTASQAARPVPAAPLPRAKESTAKRGFVTEAITKAAEGAPSDPEAKRLMIAEAAYYCAERSSMTAATADAAVARSTASLPGVMLIEFVGRSGRACRAFASRSGQVQPRSRYTRWSTLRQRDWRGRVKLGPSAIRPIAGQLKEAIREKEVHRDDD